MQLKHISNPTPEQITAEHSSRVVFNLLTDAQAHNIGAAIEELVDDGGWEVSGSDGLHLDHLETEEAAELEELPSNPWLLAYPRADDTDRALVIEFDEDGAARIYEYTSSPNGRPYVRESWVSACRDAWRAEFGSDAP